MLRQNQTLECSLVGILAQVHLHRSNVKTRRCVNLSLVFGITMHSRRIGTPLLIGLGDWVIGEVLWIVFFNVRNQSYYTDVIRRL